MGLSHDAAKVRALKAEEGQMKQRVRLQAARPESSSNSSFEIAVASR